MFQITVELKNDLAITGTLHSVDQYLNIKLNNIRVVRCGGAGRRWGGTTCAWHGGAGAAGWSCRRDTSRQPERSPVGAARSILLPLHVRAPASLLPRAAQATAERTCLTSACPPARPLPSLQVNEQKYPHMLSVRACFVRGSVVRYVQLPPGSVDVELLHDATRREARGG